MKSTRITRIVLRFLHSRIIPATICFSSWIILFHHTLHSVCNGLQTVGAHNGESKTEVIVVRLTSLVDVIVGVSDSQIFNFVREISPAQHIGVEATDGRNFHWRSCDVVGIIAQFVVSLDTSHQATIEMDKSQVNARCCDGFTQIFDIDFIRPSSQYSFITPPIAIRTNVQTITLGTECRRFAFGECWLCCIIRCVCFPQLVARGVRGDLWQGCRVCAA